MKLLKVFKKKYRQDIIDDWCEWCASKGQFTPFKAWLTWALHRQESAALQAALEDLPKRTNAAAHVLGGFRIHVDREGNYSLWQSMEDLCSVSTMD